MPPSTGSLTRGRRHRARGPRLHRGHPRGPGDRAVPRGPGDVGGDGGVERPRWARSWASAIAAAAGRRVLPRRAARQPAHVLPLDGHRADLHRGRASSPGRSTSSSRSAGSRVGTHARRSTSRRSCRTRRSRAPRPASRSSPASSCGRCSATPRSPRSSRSSTWAGVHRDRARPVPPPGHAAAGRGDLARGRSARARPDRRVAGDRVGAAPGYPPATRRRTRPPARSVRYTSPSSPVPIELIAARSRAG